MWLIQDQEWLDYRSHLEFDLNDVPMAEAVAKAGFIH
jgi:hypothetical protein